MKFPCLDEIWGQNEQRQPFSYSTDPLLLYDTEASVRLFSIVTFAVTAVTAVTVVSLPFS